MLKNLLPQSRQQLLKRTYLTRLAVVGLAVVMLLELLLLAALLPAYLAAHMHQGMHEHAISKAEQQINEGGGAVARGFLEETAALLARAHATQKHPSSTELIDVLGIGSVAGIVVTDLALTIAGTGGVQAVVSGEASTRTALVQYTEALEADPRVAEVVLPLRDLAASRQIPFAITVTFADLSL